MWIFFYERKFVISNLIKNNIPMPEVVDLKAAGYIKSQIHGIAVDWPMMYPPCFVMPIFGIRVGVYHHIGSFCVPAATQSGGKERQGL